MAKETKNTAVATTAPSAAMIALFNQPVNLDKLKRQNMPRLVLMKDMPVDAVISGRIEKVTNSPSSAVKGKCLWLTLPNGTEVLFPVTGVIRQALGNENFETLDTANKKWAGHNIAIKRLADGVSGKYKKAMFLFDVYTD